MIKLNEDQQRFLHKRKRLEQVWQWVGPLCLFSIVGLFLWLIVRTPFLVNPLEVASQIESGGLERSTLSMMAIMLPVMFLACLGLLTILVVMIYGSFYHEQKYLSIVKQLSSETEEREV